MHYYLVVERNLWSGMVQIIQTSIVFVIATAQFSNKATENKLTEAMLDVYPFLSFTLSYITSAFHPSLFFF